MASDSLILCFLFGLIALLFLLGRVNQAFTGSIETKGYPTKQLCTMPLTVLPELSGPADATLDSPRDPYNLLGDYLKPASNSGTVLANLTSECAYIADGERLIEKTGSYGQVTNNYRHKKPDNGSTWLHELSVAFYE